MKEAILSLLAFLSLLSQLHLQLQEGWILDFIMVLIIKCIQQALKVVVQQFKSKIIQAVMLHSHLNKK